jgi:hypothetical protein
MKLDNNIKRSFPFAASVVVSCLASGQVLMAQNSPFQTICTNATLQGNYGFAVSGMRPTGPGGPVEMIVGTAMTNFDGNGNLTQTDNIHGSIDGFPTPDRPGTGKYSINANCTGTMTLTPAGSPTLTLRIVVVDNGNEVRGVVVGPVTVMVTTNGRRVAPLPQNGEIIVFPDGAKSRAAQ